MVQYAKTNSTAGCPHLARSSRNTFCQKNAGWEKRTKLTRDGRYCKNFGRPAKEPEMMMKLLLLEYLYNLSDFKVIEEASLNLVYLWFLGLNPEDKLPDPSLLAKFRTRRLKDITLDVIIIEVVRQCVERVL